MIIFGLDTSTSATGWGVIDTKFEDNLRLIDSGVIKPKKDKDAIDRAIYITDEVKRLIANFKPDFVVIENLNVIRNMNTLRVLAGLIMTIEVYLRRRNMLTVMMTPSEWRKLVGIKGKTRERLKQASIDFVFEKYGEKVSDDQADAICIAEAGSHLELEVGE